MLQARSNHALRHWGIFLPLIAPLAYILMALVIKPFITCDLSPSLRTWLGCQPLPAPVPTPFLDPLKDLWARELLIAGLTSLVLTSFAGLAVALWAVHRAWPKRASRQIAITIALVFAGIYGYMAFSVFKPSLPHMEFQQLALSGVVDVSKSMGSFYAMAMTITALLVIATGYNLRSPTYTDTLEKQLEQLVNQHSRIQRILYAGAALLASSVLGTVGYFAWALAHTKFQSADAALKVVSLSTGLLYSVGLLSLYVPAALLIRYRAERAARQKFPSNLPAQTHWLKKHGIGMTLGEQTASAAALFGPALVGPALAVADLFKSP